MTASSLVGLGTLDVRVATPANLQHHFSHGRLKFYRHVQAMQRFIWRMLEGEFDRGMILCAPQHGKSEYIGGATVPWILGCNPDLRVGYVSYGARQAKKWGTRARDFFLRHGQELYGLQVNPSRRAADNWGFLDRAGGMVSVGVGGPLVGEPVDFGVIDDHFKSQKDADSLTEREKIWDWYGSSFQTRLSQHAKVLLINTRWHPDDLCGRLLELAKEGLGDKFEVLNLAAICPHKDEVPEEDWPLFFPDPLGRAPGEALCPQLHSIEKLTKARETLGEVKFWAIYQGLPKPGAGGIVKPEMFRYFEWEELPCIWDPANACWVYKDSRWRFDACIQSWDTKYALKNTTSGSYVSGQVWGLLGARAYLLDEVRGRWGVEETVQECLALCKKWPIATVKLFEPKASGTKVVARLSPIIPGFATWPCVGDKETRFRAQDFWFIGSNVFLLNPARGAFVRPWRSEICQFPRGTYADRVDACSQALDYFGGCLGSAPPQREDKPDDPMGELRRFLKV